MILLQNTRKLSYSATAILLLVVLCVGCASSERMTRMSGDVFSSYSAPKEQRIRSKKYRAIRANSSDTRYSRNQADRDGHLLTLNENLVNLWPFYFRSGDYTSVLWPMIDSDPYGFAFRPFYNHEGDDYSVLFPLSAWNTENKDGWVLNTIWDKDGFTMFPLVFSGKDYSLVLPLWYHSSDHAPDSAEKTAATTVFLPFYIGHWKRGEFSLDGNIPYRSYGARNTIEENFNFVLLGYYGEDTYKNLAEFERMFRYGEKTDRQKRAYLAKVFGATPIKLPATPREVEDLRRRVFDQLQPENDRFYGFFPILMRKSGSENTWTAFLGPLAFYKNYNYGRERGSSSLFGLLYDWEAQDCSDDHPSSHAMLNRNAFSLLAGLLMSYETENRYSGDCEELRTLEDIASRSWDISSNRAQIADLWKKIDPALQVPESAFHDSDAMRHFVFEYMDAHEYPTYLYRNFFSLLFTREKDEDKTSGGIPVLLTFWDRDRKNNSSSFHMFPLLTSISHSPEESSEDVLAGLVWHSRDEHFPKKFAHVYDRTTYFSDDEHDLVYEKNGRAFLFGYYRSDNAFLIAKDGYSAEAVNLFRSDLRKYSDALYEYQDGLQSYNSRLRNAETLPTGTKVERLEKELELARLEEYQIRLREKYTNLSRRYNNLCKSAAGNHFDIPLPDNPDSLLDVDALTGELLAKYTEERHYTDSGSAILWNRETSEDGARRWKIFFNLIAGGSKIGDSEHAHVLHFLYRYTREGDRSEKLVFPFWSEQRDGQNSTRSFMWRMWRRTIRDGKTGGYFFFIPYGDVQ